MDDQRVESTPQAGRELRGRALDEELRSLNNRVYARSVELFQRCRIGTDDQGRPTNFGQVWLLALATLIYQAHSAAVVLLTTGHSKMGRLLVRQVYEYTRTAEYLLANPDDARREFYREAFDERALIRQIGDAALGDRIRVAEATMADIRASEAGVETYRRRPFEQMVRTLNPDGWEQEYALQYRWPSQLVHGTSLELRNIFDNQGGSVIGLVLSGDTSEEQRRMNLLSLATYGVQLLAMLHDTFHLGIEREHQAFGSELNALQERFTYQARH